MIKPKEAEIFIKYSRKFLQFTNQINQNSIIADELTKILDYYAMLFLFIRNINLFFHFKNNYANKWFIF